jgi:hypothetical protein
MNSYLFIFVTILAATSFVAVHAASAKAAPAPAKEASAPAPAKKEAAPAPAPAKKEAAPAPAKKEAAPAPAPAKQAPAAAPANKVAQSSTTSQKTASVQSHTCSSTDEKTVQGTITVKNADKTAVTTQKDTIQQTLTSHVQSSSSSNSKCAVNVHTVTQKDNGDVEVHYTCSGVQDHASCQDSLHTASKSEAIQTTVGKCSKSDDQKSKAPEKPTAAGTTEKKEAAPTTSWNKDF